MTIILSQHPCVSVNPPAPLPCFHPPPTVRYQDDEQRRAISPVSPLLPSPSYRAVMSRYYYQYMPTWLFSLTASVNSPIPPDVVKLQIEVGRVWPNLRIKPTSLT